MWCGYEREEEGEREEKESSNRENKKQISYCSANMNNDFEYQSMQIFG